MSWPYICSLINDVHLQIPTHWYYIDGNVWMHILLTKLHRTFSLSHISDKVNYSQRCWPCQQTGYLLDCKPKMSVCCLCFDIYWQLLYYEKHSESSVVKLLAQKVLYHFSDIFSNFGKNILSLIDIHPKPKSCHIVVPTRSCNPDVLREDDPQLCSLFLTDH